MTKKLVTWDVGIWEGSCKGRDGDDEDDDDV
jgi:hypothetical protein